jgi:predicted esterase
LRSFAALDGHAGADLRRRLGWDDGALIAFSIAVSAEGSARPIEVMGGMFGPEIAARTDLARRALWAEGRTDPLDAAAVGRALASLSAPTPAPTAAAPP